MDVRAFLANITAAWVVAACAFALLLTVAWVGADAGETGFERPLKVRPIAEVTADTDG